MSRFPDAQTHDLKLWPQYFNAVAAGLKTFEVRVNDRGFAVGDLLRLREFNPKSDTYSGRELTMRVIYMVDLGLFGRPDLVVLSIARDTAWDARDAADAAEDAAYKKGTA